MGGRSNIPISQPRPEQSRPTLLETVLVAMLLLLILTGSLKALAVAGGQQISHIVLTAIDGAHRLLVNANGRTLEKDSEVTGTYCTKVEQIMHELDADILARLKREEQDQLTSRARVSTEEDVCAICLDELDDPVQSLCGRHIFCHKCITPWIEDHPSCPTCRYEVKDLHDDFVTWTSQDMAVFVAKLTRIFEEELEGHLYVTAVRNVWFRTLALSLGGRVSRLPQNAERHWAAGVSTYVLDYRAVRERKEAVSRCIDRLEQSRGKRSGDAIAQAREARFRTWLRSA